MSSQRYSPELQDEAGRQVLEQCYNVVEVSASGCTGRQPLEMA